MIANEISIQQRSDKVQRLIGYRIVINNGKYPYSKVGFKRSRHETSENVHFNCENKLLQSQLVLKTVLDIVTLR